MNKFEKMKENLKEIHEKYSEGNKTLELVNEELNDYKSFIKDFFSNKNERKNIYSLYENSEDLENVVECTDLYKVSSVYAEYLEGMLSFIYEIMDANVVTESEKLSVLNKKFSKAKSNDSEFIESLCDKYVKKEELPITEATGNIAFLAEFIPELDSLYEHCSRVTNNGVRSDELSTGSLAMLYESVTHYSYNTIMNAINIYESIDESVNMKNTNNEKEVFKLF